jgi:hypothetical protein
MPRRHARCRREAERNLDRPVEQRHGIHLGPACITAINKADSDNHLRRKEPPATRSPSPRRPVVVLNGQGDPLNLGADPILIGANWCQFRI